MWCNRSDLFWSPYDPKYALWNCTSFSLSVRTLISSSYLSSFSEYWERKTRRKGQTWISRGIQKWRQTHLWRWAQLNWGESNPQALLLLVNHTYLQGSWRDLSACTGPESHTYLLSLGLQWLQVVGHSFQLFLKLRAFATFYVRGWDCQGCKEELGEKGDKQGWAEAEGTKKQRWEVRKRERGNNIDENYRF